MNAPSHKDIFDALQEISAKLNALTEQVGHENDDGSGGTGLTGRIIRTEAKVLAYDRLKDRMIGGLMAAAATIPAIWWLVKDKIAAFFGVAGS